MEMNEESVTDLHLSTDGYLQCFYEKYRRYRVPLRKYP